MYIGKLNERLPVSYTITRLDSSHMPKCAECGNPFRRERLSVHWDELIASGVALHISVPAGYLLYSVVIRLGEASAPVSLQAYTADKTRLLASYCAETGKQITEKEVALSLDTPVGELILEAVSGLSDIVYESIELYGADLSGERLFPTPLTANVTQDRVALSVFATCSGCPEASDLLREKLGMTLTESARAGVCFEHCGDIAKNGFSLSVSPEKIRVQASDLRGFVMGAETLVKLSDGQTVPVCRIADAPFMEFRGVHLYLPAEQDMEFARRLVKHILSPMGYNYIILEVAGAMEFRSHPEINAAVREAYANEKAGKWPHMPHSEVAWGTTVSQQAVREFVDYVRRFGIEVIPEVQSLGHVQFMTQAHPEIAERPADAPAYEATDERLADIPPSDFYAHSFCPSNPRSYEILFDLLDEILEVFRPREFVHMGHDEVYQIGVCPICKDKDPAELFAADVKRLHDYLADRGLRMMIWADMLQPVTRYRTFGAIDRIPGDVYLLDFIWYFHTDLDIEDNLLKHGFDVSFGNMYSSHFPRFESRIRKDGIRGGQLSAWVQTSEEILAREGKLYDFLYTGQMLWSGSYTRHCRYAYDEVLTGLIPDLRQKLRGVQEPSRQPSAKQTVLLTRPFAPDRPSAGETVSVDACYDSLVFTHAASLRYRRLPWQELEEIGAYTVQYADGSACRLPVTYGGTVSHWDRRQNEPFVGQYYRHNGYSATWQTDGVRTETPDGKAATLYRWEWVNPCPEKTIRAVTYTPKPDAETGTVLCELLGVSCS